MNSLPDIVVLDFCEWLNKRLMNNVGERPSIMDIFMSHGNNRYQLEEYASEYLESKKDTVCPIKDIAILFFNSEEYYNTIRNCHKCSFRLHKQIERYYDIYDCFHCPKMYHAFYRFIKNQEHNFRASIYKDISASHLADYTRYIVLNGNTDSNLHRSPPILDLIMNSSIEISEEIDFFNWLERNIECATNVRKMPSEVFEEFVDKYISENNKTEKDKRKLLKSYQRTGWEALLEEFKVLFRIKKQRIRNISEVFERYSPHYGRYKCIILPLSDPESQRVYCSLINDFWKDLDNLSGDNLDIYYSELDTGKSGFDIAKRINSLPGTLKYKVPCLIVWKSSMQEAEELSITGLDSLQIVELIASIVGNIESNKSFYAIIKEARNKVKDFQDERKPISNYIVSGNRNVIGDNNTVGTGNVSGSSNTVIGNTVQIGNAECTSMTLKEFETAKSAILASYELDDDMKAQLVEIMETAKASVCEQSLEKEEKAKTAFGYVKSFLVKVAPNLLSALGNIATIATFFKIMG